MRARRCLVAACALSASACSSVFGLTEVHGDAAADGDARSHDGRGGDDGAFAADAFTDGCNFAPGAGQLGNPLSGESDFSRTVVARNGGFDIAAWEKQDKVELSLGTEQDGFSPRVSPDGTEVYFISKQGTAQYFGGADLASPHLAVFFEHGVAVPFNSGDQLGTPTTVAAGPRHMVIQHIDAFEEYVEDSPNGGSWTYLATIDVEKQGTSPSLSPDGRTLVFAHQSGSAPFDIARMRRDAIDGTTWTTDTLFTDTGATLGTLASPFLDCTTLYFTSNFDTGAVATQTIEE